MRTFYFPFSAFLLEDILVLFVSDLRGSLQREKDGTIEKGKHLPCPRVALDPWTRE